ncbi:MAG: DUF502 domain-containing protein [Bacteroidia bacterium]
MKYFFRGLLIAIPLAATVGIIVWLFDTIDNLLGKDHIPGLGLLIILSVILTIGAIGSSYIAQPFIDWFDDWLERTPGIKFLYSSVKDIMEALVGEKKKFSEPVMIELAADGIYKIGFITQKDLSSMGMEGFSAVYFPKSYGFMGDLYFVKNEKIKPLNANSTAVFKMVVSGGVTGVED